MDKTDGVCSLRDIAKIVGVSESTVSRALSGFKHVNEEKRKKICKVAKELGYYPNNIAKNLRVRESQDIGIIIPDIQNPFYPSVIRGIEDKVSEEGYNLLLCNSDFNENKEKKYIELFIKKKVAGVLIFPSLKIVKNLQPLERLKVPFVLADYNPHNKATNCVYTDHKVGAYLAIKYLIKNGHRNIVLYTSENNLTPSDEQMFEGYLQALKEAKIKAKKSFVFRGNLPDKGNLRKNTYQLLNKRETLDYTAILCISDMFAISIYEAAKEKKIKIPEDLSIIGYDNTFICPYMYPPLTSVSQPSYDLGFQATEMLLRNVKNKDTWQYQTIKFIPRIEERDSVRNIGK